MTPAIPGVSLAQLHVGTTLPVAETFGPTVQGEGPHTGRRCWFLRLGDCNLHCSWCDTKFTWDWTTYKRDEQVEELTAEQIIDRLYLGGEGAQAGDMVVMTGGEPLIHHHKPAFRDFLGSRFKVHLESNGTIWPGQAVARRFHHVTLSVKVAQSDDPEKRRIKPKAIAYWREYGWEHPRHVAWKFVVRDGYDLGVVDQLVQDHELPREDVWIMAEGTNPYTLLNRQAALASEVIGRGFNITTRLHTLLWPNDERGH